MSRSSCLSVQASEGVVGSVERGTGPARQSRAASSATAQVDRTRGRRAAGDDMKRLLIFTALFPPLALLVYVAPLVLNEGVPKADFIVFLIGAAYVLAIVPAGLAAAADGILSAK